MTDEEIISALAEALETVAHWCEHEPCTTCAVISDEDFDAQIGAMAMHGSTPTWVEGKPLAFAAALLPTVHEVAKQWAAEELLAAAFDIRQTTVLGHIAERLERRAAALTATPNGRNAT